MKFDRTLKPLTYQQHRVGVFILKIDRTRNLITNGFTVGKFSDDLDVRRSPGSVE
jgi:hypothetical protein